MSNDRIPERDLGLSLASPTDLVRVVKNGQSMMVPLDSIPLTEAGRHQIGLVQEEVDVLKLAQRGNVQQFSQIRGDLNDMRDVVNYLESSQGSGLKAYRRRVDLPTPPPSGDELAMVAADSNEENIGTWWWNGSVWQKVPDRVSSVESRLIPVEHNLSQVFDKGPDLYPDPNMNSPDLYLPLVSPDDRLWPQSNQDEFGGRASHWLASTRSEGMKGFLTPAWPVEAGEYIRVSGIVGSSGSGISATLVLHNTYEPGGEDAFHFENLTADASMETMGGNWRFDKIIKIRDGAVRASILAQTIPNNPPYNDILRLADFSVERLAKSYAPGSVGPVAIEARDWSNEYPDPEMRAPSLYRITNEFGFNWTPPIELITERISDTIGTGVYSENWILASRLVTSVTIIHGPAFSVNEFSQYTIAARTSYSNPVVASREVYIDWFSDWDATELISSDPVSIRPGAATGRDVVFLRPPEGTRKARFRAVKGETAEPSRLLLGGLYIKQGVERQSRIIRRPLAQDRRNIGVNGLSVESGTYPTTAGNEMLRAFTGQDAVHLRQPHLPTDLAQIQIVLPTEDSLNFVAPTTPHMMWQGNQHRAIPLDIRTTLFNTPVTLPLFRPILSNHSGGLVWWFIGTSPLHTTISGSMTVDVRMSEDDPNAWGQLLLNLRAYGAPDFEYGQNQGQRYLGSASPTGPAFKRRGSNVSYDQCAPINDEILQDMQTSSPNLYVGSDPGFFSTSYQGGRNEDLFLEDPPGSDNVMGPEVMTTKWIDVSMYDNSERSYAMTFDGSSDRFRIQWKNSEGVIFYHFGQSSNAPAYRVFSLPPEAVSFRVYYTGEGTDSADNNVDIRALSPEVSVKYDPLKGYWQRLHFDVCREVVFYPGAQYLLTFGLRTEDGRFSPGQVDGLVEWGFRYQSGGFSMLADISHRRALLAQANFKDY